MVESRDRLIERLADHAAPVRPLAPPLVAALLWLVGIGIGLTVIAALVGTVSVFLDRLGDPQFLPAWSASGAAGVLATIAAFQLSRPDRPWYWAALPWPAVGAWLWFTGYSCFQNWIVKGPDGFLLGESAMCFAFVLMLGGALGAALVLALRRSYPGHLRLFVVTLGVATASIAAAALPLFHSVDATYLDLAAHVAATALVVLFLREGPARALAR
jgi:hypothetical protein